ncbi:MAG: enoyl-CoA hydratase/isomerase family protein [Burkholderiales bacterium]|nr:enoyl-CoA hydratase/isomerase family protein [Burkholderiales bacterium]
MASQMFTEQRDGALVLTLSDPATRNSLSLQAYAAGLEAMAHAESDPEVRCVVLRGDGEHFCGGGNLQRLLAVRDRGPDEQLASMAALGAFVEALHACPKPVIAAVEGYAAGAGCALVLACDLVVAAEDAKFVLSYGRIGLSPDAGSTWQLARRVPSALALQMLWLPEPIDARRWQSWGLANEIVDHGHALPAALALAARLAAMAPNAVESAKALMREAPGSTLAAQLDRERDHFVRNLFHPNAGEGLRAFLDKRAARFVR